ncbi:MAG: AbrB/MazE/SpoVT family DNA-binding domain-containing protein [Acidobacteria bacterium]|nr:AbrB/MazE/SpoVT family DNA-binding domain-containing protein [Acidobacteriota bacterium]
MTITVTNDIQRLLPTRVRRQAGIKAGDELEVQVSGGIVTLIPKLPAGDDEYTPEQRRVIDAQIAEGLEDVKKGRLHGPFETHEEMIKFLHSRARKSAPRKSPGKTR